MTPGQIDRLAERVWRRVIGYVGYESDSRHKVCLNGAPDDCDLFREIHDEMQMFEKEKG